MKNNIFTHDSKQGEKKLKASEIRYRRLFEAAKDGILILDSETGNIIDANPFIIDTLGYTLGNILGKKLWEIGIFSDKEQSELVFTELQKNKYIRYEDLPLQTKDGKKIEVEFVSNAYLVDNEEVIQCNIRDNTEHKQNLIKQNIEYQDLNNQYIIINKELTESLNRIQKMNADLVASRNKAEESDTLKSAFLANMSHEIRTPMNAIMGFAEFLTQPGLEKDKFEQYAEIIKISGHQLLTIINDILDISKIEAGQIIIASENININQLLKALYLIYKEQAGFKKISLSYSCGQTDDLSQTLTDENRLKQVLCNLLNNALKFTYEGQIEFGYTLKENNIEFYVKDNGIGIAPENHSLIFNRFRQVDTKDTREYGGNGLGLSISKALVEKLGGTMTVTSALGKGSTFFFTIPYIQNIKAINNVEKTIEPDAAGNWKGKTILLAEDEVHSNMYIEELLADSGIQMLHAWNGKEAVEMVKKHPDISLVLMDIKMPVMDGYEATRLIKKVRPQLPVIVQTAYAQQDDRLKALKAGCDNYFSKPIQKDLFLKAIASYIFKDQVSSSKC